MSKIWKAKSRGGTPRHTHLRPARASSGRPHRELKATPAGVNEQKKTAISLDLNPGAAWDFGIKKAPDNLNPDDGIAYESLGDTIKEFTQETFELRSMTAWFAPSPYMVVLLKQLIKKLVTVSGLGGSYFLDGLGFSSFDELDQLGEMSGVAVADYLDAAILSVPADMLEAAGLEISSKERRAAAHRRRPSFVNRRP